MNSGNHKSIVKILGTATTNGATVTANIDTLNYDYVTIDVILGTADVVSNKPSTLKLSECDTTVLTDFANVSGFVGGTDFTVANSDTSNENVYRFNVDCKARKRYLKLTVTPLTTQAIVLDARLSRGVALPISATNIGVANLVEG